MPRSRHSPPRPARRAFCGRLRRDPPRPPVAILPPPATHSSPAAPRACRRPTLHVRHRRIRQRRRRARRAGRHARRNDAAARASRSRCAGPVRARAGALRAHAAVGDRPRRQSAADVDGRRPADRRVQRRDLQLPRAARRARSPRLRVSHRRRHRGPAGGVARVGRSAGRPAARDVRLRAVGRIDAHAVRGPRSPRRQAVPLRLGRRDVRVRLRAQGGLRASGGRARRRPGLGAAVPGRPVHPRRAFDLARRGQAAAGACADALRRRSLGAPLLVARLRRQARAVRRRGCGRARPRTARVGRGHAGRRRAARHVRQRRRRLEPRRGADDRPHGTAGRHLQHRVRGRRRGERAPRGRARRRTPRQPSPRGDVVARSRARCVRPLGRRVRRAVRRPGGAADDAARAARAASRHRRADRRRRRRGVRRLLELPQARARRALDALAGCRRLAGAGAGSRAAGRRAQGPAAARDRRAAAAPLPHDSEPVRRAAAAVAALAGAARRDALAARTSASAPRARTPSAIRRITSTGCCTSTPGSGCRTTC